ncbi:MAG: hypothetical protein ACTSQI_16170 [Candidatus Helarchaeota archaeon]
MIDNTNLVKEDYGVSGQIVNNTYNWYRISYVKGEDLQVNISSTDNGNFTIIVVISDKVKPQNDIGSTPVLVGGFLNTTQNVSLSYSSSNIFREWFGVYLLVISYNDSNPLLMNYTINCTHAIKIYSYTQYYTEVLLLIYLLVVGPIIAVAGAVTMWIIIKWRRRRR